MLLTHILAGYFTRRKTSFKTTSRLISERARERRSKVSLLWDAVRKGGGMRSRHLSVKRRSRLFRLLSGCSKSTNQG